MKSKIITPVVTILDEYENPDFLGNKKVIDFLIDNGVNGILVLGSTGEFTNLSLKQKKEFLKFYFDYTDGRVELYAGTGCLSYKETLELSNYASQLGYKASMVITPFYYSLSQEKIFDFYNRLANECRGQIYVYNFPARSGSSIDVGTLVKLNKLNDNIIGLKDSVTNPEHTINVLNNIDKETFSVYSGFDSHFLINVSNNGSGCIGGLSNIVPEIWSDLVNSLNQKELQRSLELTKIIEKLMPLYDMDSSSAYLFKKLLIHRGLDIPVNSIFPYNSVSNDVYKLAERTLDNALENYSKISSSIAL